MFLNGGGTAPQLGGDLGGVEKDTVERGRCLVDIGGISLFNFFNSKGALAGL